MKLLEAAGIAAPFQPCKSLPQHSKVSQSLLVPLILAREWRSQEGCKKLYDEVKGTKHTEI